MLSSSVSSSTPQPSSRSGSTKPFLGSSSFPLTLPFPAFQLTSLCCLVNRVHYIPIHPSFFNLPSILAFLRDNDVLASKIASNGRAFAKSTLGEKEKVLGLVGLLIEYGRDWATKRGAMNWSG